MNFRVSGLESDDFFLSRRIIKLLGLEWILTDRMLGLDSIFSTIAEEVVLQEVPKVRT